jgi:hypothetical protein
MCSSLCGRHEQHDVSILGMQHTRMSCASRLSVGPPGLCRNLCVPAVSVVVVVPVHHALCERAGKNDQRSCADICPAVAWVHVCVSRSCRCVRCASPQTPHMLCQQQWVSGWWLCGRHHSRAARRRRGVWLLPAWQWHSLWCSSQQQVRVYWGVTHVMSPAQHRYRSACVVYRIRLSYRLHPGHLSAFVRLLEAHSRSTPHVYVC